MMMQSELVEYIDVITTEPSYPRYNEEHQDFPVKFQSAFPDKSRGTYKIIHGPVICRDFLGDVAVSLQFNLKSSIYGFSVDVQNQKGKEFRNELALVLTFPSPESKKSFENNVNPLLYCFGISLSYAVINSLNLPDNQLIVNFGRNISPVGLSLLTWLFKIAAKPLEQNKEVYDAVLSRNVELFLKLYIEAFPGKEANYISRVSPQTFAAFVPGIIDYAVGRFGFTYLQDKKSNISFVHNNTGFFSQFSDKVYGSDEPLILRRIFGTFAKAVEIPVPFSFTPLSVEEILKYLPPDFGLIIAGKSVYVDEEGNITTKTKSNLDYLKAKQVAEVGLNFTEDVPQEIEAEGVDSFEEDHEEDEAGEAW